MARDRGGRGALAPRLAWAVPAAFLCLLVPARAGAAVGLGNGAAGAAMAVALFALPLLYTIPRGRAVWDRHLALLLTTQAVLTYLPFILFGQSWAVGLSGLLGGLMLLTLPPRVGWVLFLAVVAAEGVLRIGVLGVYPEGGAQFVSAVFVVPIDTALPLFGLVRLSDLVTELRAAQTELVGLAVTRERLRAVARLRAAIGGRLEAVAHQARAAVAVLSDSPDQARACLTRAAGIARHAVEQVRRNVAEDERDSNRPLPPRTGSTVASRLALLVLVVDLAVYAGHHVVIVADAATGAARAVGTAATVAIVVLQLYHSLGGRAGTRPRAWGLTLPLQILLLFALVAATTGDEHISGIGMAAFPAGSALLLLARRWAWPVFTAVAASVGVHWLLSYPGDVAVAAYLVGVAASTSLAVYGLSRLTDVAERLEATRRELARAAADRERLRVAQDIHDLLGLGLSAVALKCDLAGRLIGRDDARTRGELDALVRLAAQARADIRAVTTGEHGLSLRAELDVARELLASTGMDVQVCTEPLEQLPADVEAVLATVLREAVTNVLRHARAARCEIEVVQDGQGVTLRVANDGRTDEAPDPAGEDKQGRGAGGHGLANLVARAAAAGGRLTVRPDGGHFELMVQVPLAARTSLRSGADDVVGLLGQDSG